MTTQSKHRMPQTIKEAADYLAGRYVFAQSQQKQAGVLSQAGTWLADKWKGLDQTQQHALMGAGVGAGMGGLYGTVSGNKKRSPWVDAMIGGGLGAAAGGVGSMLWNTPAVIDKSPEVDKARKAVAAGANSLSGFNDFSGLAADGLEAANTTAKQIALHAPTATLGSLGALWANHAARKPLDKPMHLGITPNKLSTGASAAAQSIKAIAAKTGVPEARVASIVDDARAAANGGKGGGNLADWQTNNVASIIRRTAPPSLAPKVLAAGRLADLEQAFRVNADTFAGAPDPIGAVRNALKGNKQLAKILYRPEFADIVQHLNYTPVPEITDVQAQGVLAHVGQRARDPSFAGETHEIPFGRSSLAAKLLNPLAQKILPKNWRLNEVIAPGLRNRVGQGARFAIPTLLGMGAEAIYRQHAPDGMGFVAECIRPLRDRTR